MRGLTDAMMRGINATRDHCCQGSLMRLGITAALTARILARADPRPLPPPSPGVCRLRAPRLADDYISDDHIGE